MRTTLSTVRKGMEIRAMREKRWATRKLTTVKAECTFKDISARRKRFLEDDGN